MKQTKLPLWYLIGIVVLLIVSILSYIGIRSAVKAKDIDLVLKFQYFDFMLIGVWLVINIVMIFYLTSKKAMPRDYIFPAYFIAVHMFYIAVIFASYYGRYLSNSAALIISLVTSIFELTYAIVLMVPYIQKIGSSKEQRPIKNIQTKKSKANSKKTNKNPTKKTKTLPKKNMKSTPNKVNSKKNTSSQKAKSKKSTAKKR